MPAGVRRCGGRQASRRLPFALSKEKPSMSVAPAAPPTRGCAAAARETERHAGARLVVRGDDRTRVAECLSKPEGPNFSSVVIRVGVESRGQS